MGTDGGRNEEMLKESYQDDSTASRPAPGELAAALLILAHSRFLDTNDLALIWSSFDRTLRKHVDVCQQGREPRGLVA